MAATETETDALETPAEPVLQIEVKVNTTSTCERHVVVEIPESEVQRYRRQSFDDVMPKAELPGFRAGKAPRKLVETKFKDQVAEQVKSNLVMDSLQQITEGEHFSAISEPNFDFEAIDIPDSGSFKYEFTIEVRPDFPTPEWTGLKLTKPICNLSDEQIDAHLSKVLSRFTTPIAVDDVVHKDDLVVLNATFSHEGKQVSSFEEEAVAVRGSLSFGDAQIEDFESLIVGKREGDKFTVSITLSDSAAKDELKGAEVQAEFEIHEVQRIEVADISHGLLENLGFDDVEELRTFARTELERQFEYHQLQAVRKQIVDELTKGADWEMPASLIKRQTNRELQRMMLELQRSGFSHQQINSYLNASRRNAQETTIRSLREHFILEKIAEDLEIEPKPEDYDKEIALIAEQNDASPRKIRARLEKSGQMDAIRNQIIEREVVLRITDAGTITEEEDYSFLKTDSEGPSLNFSIAGELRDIPEAMHDNDPGALPGAPKLPSTDKEE
ncbi:MAG: trigger factor [Planctomycetales bacterium]|nr:trigger factor [Planctomycetales bacterium]